MAKWDPVEYEANIFASRLLAPAIVLHSIGITDVDGIAQLCGLSHQAAKYRAERIKVLDMRAMYDVHPLERQVHRQFLEFIKNIK